MTISVKQKTDKSNKRQQKNRLNKKKSVAKPIK